MDKDFTVKYFCIFAQMSKKKKNEHVFCFAYLWMFGFFF